MSTVREFFVSEASECLDALASVLDRADESSVEADDLFRWSRRLRGSAQMAREQHVYRVAEVLETATRELGRRTLTWTPDFRSRAEKTVAALRRMIEGTDESAAKQIAGPVLDRWQELGISVSSKAPAAMPPESAEPMPPGGGADGPPPQFRDYAAREAAGILAVLQSALRALARQPMDREPLKAILRRQRALLGAAPLESFPVLEETLETIDDVTHLVARSKVAVEGEWLDVYRAAGDVLDQIVPQLEHGASPVEPAAPLERLRALRDGLVERYGDPDDRRPAEAPDQEDLSAQDQDLFLQEAKVLIDRIDGMATRLSTAAPDRERALRRELHNALVAVRDNAQTFGFNDAARVADEARPTARRGGARDVLAVLDRLRRTVGLPAPERSEPEPAPTKTGPPQEPASPERPPDAGQVVPIEDLRYGGERALRRALALEDELRSALDGGASARARALADEVFDLIRLGLE